MAVHRWDPLRDLVSLQERINRLFEDVFVRSGVPGQAEAITASGYKPPVDILELPDRYVVRADLPGVAASDLEVEVEDSTLSIRGERRGDSAVPRDAYLRMERPQGRFAVQVALPSSVNRQAIHASHRDGIVEIALPKTEEKTPSRVKIEVG